MLLLTRLACSSSNMAMRRTMQPPFAVFRSSPRIT